MIASPSPKESNHGRAGELDFDNPDRSSLTCCDDEDHDDLIRPFEWLTSPASLTPILQEVASHLFTTPQQLASCGDNKHGGIIKDTSSTTSSCHVLHVGSGSSIWSEYLLNHPFFAPNVAQIVNIDKDQSTLRTMQERWDRQKQRKQREQQFPESEANSGKLIFQCVDWVNQRIPYPNESFDLILDKSTLDCTLCSDQSTAWLLHEVYRLLKPNGGVYVLVSFHHLDLLLPLLSKCPGCTDWAVTHYTIPREVEDLVQKKRNAKATTTPSTTAIEINHPRDGINNEPSDSHNNLTSQREFEARNEWLETLSDTNSKHHKDSSPLLVKGAAATMASSAVDGDHRRTVNVVIARRGETKQQTKNGMLDDDSGPTTTANQEALDFDAIYQHTHRTNDHWYKTQHPMLTEERVSDIRQAFSAAASAYRSNDDNTNTTKSEGYQGGGIPLRQCYEILFTDEEREHLTFSFFMEDWTAFLEKQIEQEEKQDHGENRKTCLEKDSMTVDVALAFLEEMQ
ncbi:hypothetical protein ACA910_004059 [Epithemia clementina (nom. ined.)]